MPISILNSTRRRTPRLSFELLKNKVLGEKYELSLVFCGNTLSHQLNKTCRDKDKPTNVLSFPLSKTSGEIFINLSLIKPFSVEKLFVHGLLHLKGMEHGAKMEEAEEKFLREIFPRPKNGSPNRNRH